MSTLNLHDRVRNFRGCARIRAVGSSGGSFHDLYYRN